MTQHFQSIGYEPGRDVPRLVQFVTETAGRHGPTAGYMHLGDLLWCTFLASLPDGRGAGQLWEDDSGDLAGYAWTWGPDDAIFYVRPDMKSKPSRWDLTEVMLEWLTERYRGVDPT